MNMYYDGVSQIVIGNTGGIGAKALQSSGQITSTLRHGDGASRHRQHHACGQSHGQQSSHRLNTAEQLPVQRKRAPKNAAKPAAWLSTGSDLDTATSQSITTLPFTDALYSCSGSDPDHRDRNR